MDLLISRTFICFIYSCYMSTKLQQYFWAVKLLRFVSEAFPALQGAPDRHGSSLEFLLTSLVPSIRSLGLACPFAVPIFLSPLVNFVVFGTRDSCESALPFCHRLDASPVAIQKDLVGDKRSGVDKLYDDWNRFVGQFVNC